MDRTVFGPLALDIPKGWSDTSVITLVGPPLAPAALTVGGAGSTIRPSALVRYVSLAEPMDLVAYAELQERLLMETTPGLAVIARGEATATPASAPARTLE